MMVPNGYRISGVSRSGNLLSLVADLRQRMDDAYEKAYLQLVTAVAVDWADRVLLGEPMVEEEDKLFLSASPLMSATVYLGRIWADIERKGLHAPELDLQFRVFLLADKGRSSPLYGLVSTHRDDLLGTWEATEGVQPWPYYEGRERPPGVAAHSWKLRWETWTRLLGSEGEPRLRLTWGLLGQMHHVNVMFHEERFAPYIPDRATRARAVAERRAAKLEPQPLPEERETVVTALATEIESELAELKPEMLRLLPGSKVL